MLDYLLSKLYADTWTHTAYSGVKRMQIRTGPARYQGGIAVPLETRASPLGFQ